MGAVKSKIDAMDFDKVFSYSTLKVVTIQDRRLGFLHYGFQLGIFIYIVVYTIVIQQRYLRTEAPYGAIRSTLQEPLPPWNPATNVPYCLQNNATYNGRNNLNCAYVLGQDAVYPPAAIDSIFITTRIRDTYYTTPPGCTSTYGVPSTDVACAPSTASTISSRYYVSGIENYTVYIEHAIFGQTNKIAETNGGLKGELILHNSTKTIKFEDKRPADIFSLQTILDASGLSSLEVPSNVTAGQNCRYDGVLILGVIKYSNRQRGSSQLKYSYEFFVLPGSDVVAQEPTSINVGTGQTYARNRHGVRILFVVTGLIGRFDFPTLLTALVNGFVLLKVATTIVDLLLLYIMPQKDIYKKHKFEVTEDFSDVRAMNRKASLKGNGAEMSGAELS